MKVKSLKAITLKAPRKEASSFKVVRDKVNLMFEE